VGGLKLESSTISLRTGPLGRRGAGSASTALELLAAPVLVADAELCGRVHSTRSGSRDDWNAVSDRAKKSTSCPGFGLMLGGGGAWLIVFDDLIDEGGEDDVAMSRLQGPDFRTWMPGVGLDTDCHRRQEDDEVRL